MTTETNVGVSGDSGDSTATRLRDIEFTTNDGQTQSLADHHGQVVLIVNVASKCGLTPQYEGLQRLYDDKRDQGLTILAFPANDFLGQEPGTDEEIAEFCSVTYAVTFPLMSKITVTGDDKHPLYSALTELQPTADGKEPFRERLRGGGITPTEDPDVLWNFEKFLIDRTGAPIARFAPTVTPDDPQLVAAIDQALA